MENKTPVSPDRYFSSPSNKLRLFINHYEKPCRSNVSGSLISKEAFILFNNEPRFFHFDWEKLLTRIHTK